MKKILAILLAVLFLMSLAACGEDNSGSDASSDETASVTQTEKATEAVSDKATEAVSDMATEAKADATEKTAEPTEAKQDEPKKSDSGSSKKYATLQEYYDDPANTKGIDEIKEAGQGVMEIDITVDGSVLVYDFTYSTTLDSSMIPTVKETLDQVLDTSASTFESLIATMQKDIDEDVSLMIIYRNGDGTEITERTYYPD